MAPERLRFGCSTRATTVAVEVRDRDVHHPASDVDADDVARVRSGAVDDRGPAGTIRPPTDRTHQTMLLQIQKRLSHCRFGEAGLTGDLGARRLTVLSQPVRAPAAG